jgi:hypothetical protein
MSKKSKKVSVVEKVKSAISSVLYWGLIKINKTDMKKHFIVPEAMAEGAHEINETITIKGVFKKSKIEYKPACQSANPWKLFYVALSKLNEATGKSISSDELFKEIVNLSAEKTSEELEKLAGVNKQAADEVLTKIKGELKKPFGGKTYFDGEIIVHGSETK